MNEGVIYFWLRLPFKQQAAVMLDALLTLVSKHFAILTLKFPKSL